MSLGASLVSLTRSASSSAVHVVLGTVRGVARALSGSDRERPYEARAAAWTEADAGPVPAAEPARPTEPVVTEPTVASRSEAHGGAPGRHADDLYEEAVDDEEVPDPVEELTRGDGPGLDPAVARAVRSEAEVMKRAARSKKGL